MIKTTFFLIALSMPFLAAAEMSAQNISSYLGYSGEVKGGLLELELIDSGVKGDTHYAFVKFTHYTNGECRPRGTCGCGTDTTYASIIKTPTSSPVIQSATTNTCARTLDSRVITHKAITGIVIDDLAKSCASENEEAGMSWYIYDRNNPGEGILSVSKDNFQASMAEEVSRSDSTPAEQHKCFFERHLMVSDDWGGAYQRSLVFRRVNKPSGSYEAGEFVGFYSQGKLIPSDDKHRRPPRMRQKVGPDPQSPYKSLRKNELAKRALAAFRDEDYATAEMLYRLAMRPEAGKPANADPGLINDLALTLLKLGRLDASQSWSETVLNLPNNVSNNRYRAAAAYNLGIVFERRGDYPQALNSFELALKTKHTRAAAAGVARMKKHLSGSGN